MTVFCGDHLGFSHHQGHRIPIEKYSLLREAFLRARLVPPADPVVPEQVTDEQISVPTGWRMYGG